MKRQKLKDLMVNKNRPILPAILQLAEGELNEKVKLDNKYIESTHYNTDRIQISIYFKPIIL